MIRSNSDQRVKQHAGIEPRHLGDYSTAVADKKLYRFWEYVFEDDGQYQPLKFQRGEAFLVKPEKVRLTVEELLRSHLATQRDKRLWDVPQADSFWRVAELPLVVEQGIDTASKMAAHFRFDPRQSSYYRQAAEFLGLARLDEIHHRYELTDLGREYAGRPADERRQLLAGILVHFPPMRAVLELSAKAGGRGVTKQQIADLIERHSKIRKSTPVRRASTLLAWLRWLEAATGAVEVSPTGFMLR